MAIALGQPVEEITHGLEGIKIDGHVRIPDQAEAQPGSGTSSPEVASVQAHPVGHEHSGGEMEAYSVEQGSLRPAIGLTHPFENPAMEHGYSGVDYLHYTTEQYPQHSYADVAQVPYQGPIYTGYPAPVMNFNGYYPYPLDGVVYQSPAVDYSTVYNQNYYYSAPSAAPYGVGYSSPYGYSQYQVAPAEHYNVHVASSPLNEDGMVIPELQLQDPAGFAPYAYQPMSPNVGHGQWVPMSMVGSPPAGESVANFNVVSYADTCAPGPLNVQPHAWVPQPDRPKGLNEGDESKLGLQQLSAQSDSKHDNMQNDYRLNLQRIDPKVVDNKKQVKKQLGFFYGPTVPGKGSWVRSGQLQHYMSPQHPLKPFTAKNKSSGRLPNFEPLAKAEVNLANFSIDFEDAKHFIIKSFSEENVFRSIQYGVWASTPNGNKKLDEAFQDAQGRGIGKAKGCPVFLYFSVNGSGRFCGVAEMVGPVDYNNTMDFWERNRWCGSFPVKWHFIKDIPHCQLRRIILQNNENKPVTSSRDTQEVNFEQGLQMLSIIRNYATKASILDNFPSLQKSGLDVKVEQPTDAKVEQPPMEPPMESTIEPNSTMENQEAQQESNTIVSEKSNALRASNGETKAREMHSQGKPKVVETTVQSAAGESGGRKADKENVMVSNVSSTVAV